MITIVLPSRGLVSRVIVCRCQGPTFDVVCKDHLTCRRYTQLSNRYHFRVASKLGMMFSVQSIQITIPGASGAFVKTSETGAV